MICEIGNKITVIGKLVYRCDKNPNLHGWGLFRKVNTFVQSTILKRDLYQNLIIGERHNR